MECPGTDKCQEINEIGEYPFPSQVEFNMAVFAHCGDCPDQEKD